MKRIITVLVVAVLLAVIVPAGLGCTETPSEFEVSGTIEMTEQLMNPNPETENDKMTFKGNTAYFDVHGTQEGTIVLENTMVIDLASGSYTIEGQGTFTGTVKGKSGSYDLSAAGSGQFTSPMGASGEGTGEITIISGTGELANLRGSLHTELKFDNTGRTETYSGTLRFEK
jgi:hypothetical protein